MSDDSARPATAGVERAASVDVAEAWMLLLRQLANAGGLLSTLALAELRLAAGDLRRAVLVSLLILPVLLLAWLGTAALLCWAAFTLSGSAVAALAVFVVLQLLALVWLRSLLAAYRRNLTLPATRQQLKLILEDLQGASRRADQ